jgi:multiple sugar transport system substrate-binding protein
LPTPDLTWDEYAKLAVELTKAGGKDNYWGGPYGARYAYVFDAWLRQRGKSLYKDATLGFDVEDAKEWYSFWEDLRKKGGTVAADVQTLDQNTIDTNCLAIGKSAMGMAYSNQLVGYQLISKRQAGHHHAATREEGRPFGPLLSPGADLERRRDDEERRGGGKVHQLLRQRRRGRQDPWRRARRADVAGCARGHICRTSIRRNRQTVKYVNLLKDQVGDYPAPHHSDRRSSTSVC